MIEETLPIVDLVVILTTAPSMEIMEYLPEMKYKVNACSAIRKKENYMYEIGIEGGITVMKFEEMANLEVDAIIME